MFVIQGRSIFRVILDKLQRNLVFEKDFQTYYLTVSTVIHVFTTVAFLNGLDVVKETAISL